MSEQNVFSLFSKTQANTAWSITIDVDSPARAFLVNRAGTSRLREDFVLDFPEYLGACRKMLSTPPEADFLPWLMENAASDDDIEKNSDGFWDFTGHLITDKLYGQSVKNSAYKQFPDGNTSLFARAVLWVMNQALSFEIDKLLVDIDAPIFLTGTLVDIYPAFYETLVDDMVEVYRM